MQLTALYRTQVLAQNLMIMSSGASAEHTAKKNPKEKMGEKLFLIVKKWRVFSLFVSLHRIKSRSVSNFLSFLSLLFRISSLQ